MGDFERVFWFSAIPASVVLLVQLFLTFMGFDGIAESLDMDVDADFDGDADVDTDVEGGSFPFFTFRNFIAFFAVFGWTGICMVNSGYKMLATILISFIVGILMMFLISLLYVGMAKLASSGGTYKLSQAVGKRGTMYIRVCANGASVGRVNVMINGQIRELDAITDGNEELSANTEVKIKSISNNKLVVERA